MGTLMRRIFQAITLVRDGLLALASGDLRDRQITASHDETGEMAAALQSAIRGMREAIGQEQIQWAEIAASGSRSTA